MMKLFNFKSTPPITSLVGNIIHYIPLLRYYNKRTSPLKEMP
jgi:hypothetical protein